MSTSDRNWSNGSVMPLSTSTFLCPYFVLCGGALRPACLMNTGWLQVACGNACCLVCTNKKKVTFHYNLTKCWAPVWVDPSPNQMHGLWLRWWSWWGWGGARGEDHALPKAFSSLQSLIQSCGPREATISILDPGGFLIVTIHRYFYANSLGSHDRALQCLLLVNKVLFKNLLEKEEG